MRKVRTSKTRRVAKTYETVNQYRGQHDELEVESIDPNDIRAKRVRVLRPNRLRKYLGMKSISRAQCEAGEMLASLWERAGKDVRTTANYTGVKVSSGFRDVTGAEVDADRALRAALRGDRARYADLLVSVCCYDVGVRDTRRLRRALTALGVHFGLIHTPR
jgi:hypothetical protein